jgi:hypothetical protein
MNNSSRDEMYEKNSADHKKNTEIAKELNITPVLDKIRHYKRNCSKYIAT